MQNKPIRNVYKCRLEALTPLHVGSGETLRSGFDFFVDSRRVHVINTARLFRKVQKIGSEKIKEFTTAIEEGKAQNWLKQHGISMEEIAISAYPTPKGKKTPREIRAHIKDGFGVPYLPGSSIKGALRTAIIRKLAKKNNSKIKGGSKNLKFADRTLCESLLGNDAKSNLMRTLTVGDFAMVQGGIDLHIVWVNRLILPENFAGKFPIYIEGPAKAAVATGTISLDEFLPRKDTEKSCFRFKAHLSLDWLLAACRELTSHTIETELAFLKGKSGKPVNDLISFYQSLAEDQKKLGENEAIIQMAWGGGWRGMTGQLLEAEDITPQIRKDFNLAPKYLQFPFPKSRRVVAANGADMSMGWSKISFISKEALQQKEKERKQQEIILKQEEEKRRVELERLNTERALENFKNRVSQCPNLPGEIDLFVQQVRQQNSREIRMEMCHALLRKAKSLKKKQKFSKALQNDKKWTVKLKTLCDENEIPL